MDFKTLPCGKVDLTFDINYTITIPQKVQILKHYLDKVHIIPTGNVDDDDVQQYDNDDGDEIYPISPTFNGDGVRWIASNTGDFDLKHLSFIKCESIADIIRTWIYKVNGYQDYGYSDDEIDVPDGETGRYDLIIHRIHNDQGGEGKYILTLNYFNTDAWRGHRNRCGVGHTILEEVEVPIGNFNQVLSVFARAPTYCPELPNVKFML